ncbi:hypothetical protein AS031_05740 [Pseudarthrobacter enclensis]|uniref:Uncharacterized protein n=1 Tax=Pseudarthrobacter enclensis TaxID=993070 RepID=A0A0V8IS61_9MICC|nr:hypothetical protein AS031_05740 [Pseudarthrobacter enclensis]
MTEILCEARVFGTRQQIIQEGKPSFLEHSRIPAMEDAAPLYTQALYRPLTCRISPLSQRESSGEDEAPTCTA